MITKASLEEVNVNQIDPIDETIAGLEWALDLTGKQSAVIKTALELAHKTGKETGYSAALDDVMTIEDLAAELGVSRRRARAIAENRKSKHGIGVKTAGGAWLINRNDLDLYRPDPKFRNDKNKAAA